MLLSCSSPYKAFHCRRFSYLLHPRYHPKAFHTIRMPSATPPRLPYHLYAFYTTHTPPPLTRPPHRLHTFHNHLHANTASAVGIDRHVAMVETQTHRDRPLPFLGNLESWSLGDC